MFMSGSQLIGFGAGGRTLGAFSDTFTATLTSNDSGLEDDSIRQILPNTAFSVSGDVIRATFEASSAASLNIDNVSIMQASGTASNGTGTIYEFKFSGASGFSISAGQTITSDNLEMPFSASNSYIIAMDFSSTNGNPRRLDGGSYENYIKTPGDSYNDLTPTGFVSGGLRTYCVNKIEVASYG